MKTKRFRITWCGGHNPIDSADRELRTDEALARLLSLPGFVDEWKAAEELDTDTEAVATRKAERSGVLVRLAIASVAAALPELEAHRFDDLMFDLIEEN